MMGKMCSQVPFFDKLFSISQTEISIKLEAKKVDTRGASKQHVRWKDTDQLMEKLTVPDNSQSLNLDETGAGRALSDSPSILPQVYVTDEEGLHQNFP